MALRSPTQTHSFWGAYTPPGTPLPTSTNVEVGDLAFDQSTGQLVVCTAVGPVVWAPANTPSGAASGDLSGTYPGPTVVALQGNPVSSSVPSDGQVLTWNGTDWVPGAPAAGGSGGGGQVYFLNAAAGQTPNAALNPSTKQLTLVADVGATTVTSPALTGSYQYVASFVTDVGVPGLTSIPAGLWDFNIWAQSTVVQPNVVLFRISIYVSDGDSPLVLVATGNPTPLYDPTSLIQYVSSVLVPQTTVIALDRVYIEIEATTTGVAPDTITFYLGAATPSHVHTSLPSVAGTGIVHVVAGVLQSPASQVNLTTEVSGTLPVGNGGTGSSATPSNGQLLIGNGTGFTLAALTSGSGISIVDTAGAIAISSSVTVVPSASFQGENTGTSPLVVGSIWLKSGQAIAASANALVGTVGAGTATLRLIRQSTGALIASWSQTGAIANTLLTSAPTTAPADDWYTFDLAGSAANTVSRAYGVYFG